jgi:5-amino-6-(5-phosphoribosylamino)uracil reductase
MFEGSGAIHAQFLRADLVDEIQLAVGPVPPGNLAPPRFVSSRTHPGGPRRRMQLAEMGDVAVLRYIPSCV